MEGREASLGVKVDTFSGFRVSALIGQKHALDMTS